MHSLLSDKQNPTRKRVGRPPGVIVWIKTSGAEYRIFEPHNSGTPLYIDKETYTNIVHKPLRDGGESFDQRRNDANLQSKAFSLFSAHPEFCDELLRSLVCLRGDESEQLCLGN